MKHDFCLLALLPLVSSCGPVNYGCVDRFNLYSDFESLDADFRASLKQENEKNSEPCVTRLFDPVPLSAPNEENRTYSLTGLCCCKYRREGNFE
ncbi:MAG TPA: hypothetical protein DEA63_02260 [Firmicutes bacterium]|nr:hypothetical protein [Bacillota bacterium]